VGKISRQFDFEPEVVAHLSDGENLCGAIDVSLDKMTTHTAISSERAFKINRASAAQLPQIGAVERFFKQVERQMLIAIRPDGQATAVHSDTVTAMDIAGDAGRGDLELSATIACANPKDGANFLNKAGEHRFREARRALQETRAARVSQSFFCNRR
jgi:hypothetical protein